jgi:hypothetical protein
VAQVGSGSAYDVGFISVTGAQVVSCANTGGGPLRIHSV